MKMKKLIGGLAIAVFSMGLFFTTTNKSNAIENFSLTELVGLQDANAENYSQARSECNKGCHPKADSQCKFQRPWLFSWASLVAGHYKTSAIQICYNGAPGGSVLQGLTSFHVN